MPIFSPGLAPAGAGRFWNDMPAEGEFVPGGPKYAIRGVTRDAGTNPLGSCTVLLFRTRDNALMDQGVSDGSGNYTFQNVTPGDTYYVVAYLPGSPDVFGSTLDTLTGS